VVSVACYVLFETALVAFDPESESSSSNSALENLRPLRLTPSTLRTLATGNGGAIGRGLLCHNLVSKAIGKEASGFGFSLARGLGLGFGLGLVLVLLELSNIKMGGKVGLGTFGFACLRSPSLPPYSHVARKPMKARYGTQFQMRLCARNDHSKLLLG